MKLACQTLPYTSVYIDADLHVVHIICEGYVPSSVFRQTISTALEIVKNEQFTAGIYNVSKLRSLHPHDQDWLIDEILPTLMHTSMTKVAIMESTLGASQLNFNHLVYTLDASCPFELQYFEDVDSALEWVSQPVDKDTSTTFSFESKDLPFI
ncbi:hypothetical protein [Rufibacter immobilis]|uniref:hypothetical protein n=1 Tax=Rufibacter immobilis TaxID=1348778 RepID=UPI0035E771AB